jgi:urea transport system permease protein
MVFLNWKNCPGTGTASDMFWFAYALMVVLVPGLAGLRVRLVSRSARASPASIFSIITQAMTYALMLLFFRNEMASAATTA